METPSPSSRVVDAVLAVLNSRAGNAFLVLLWPMLVAALGLPLGIAEAALEVYLGRDVEWAATTCLPCEPPNPESASPAMLTPRDEVSDAD